MKIEVGKYYKTRDGQKVGPMYSVSLYDENIRVLYADVDDVARAFYIDGGKRRFEGEVGDLIAEWTDGPVTGTLKELNVKPGDVVENQKTKCRYMVAPDMTVGGPHVNICIDDYKIISRSSRAPTPTIIVNGIEVPEPVREALEKRQVYWLVFPVGAELSMEATWYDEATHHTRLNRGLIHLTEAAAVAHAKAMLAPSMRGDV